MREILFRAKRLDNGEWVEGWYCRYPFGRWPLKDAIIPSEEAESGHFVQQEIDPATLGQFVGVYDKNGKKIFEGDIVHICGEIAEVIFWMGFFAWKEKDGKIHDFIGMYCEVVGNKFDNPELLEVII